MTILEQNVEKLIDTIILDRYTTSNEELVETLATSLFAIVEQFENAEANGFPIRAELRKTLLKAAVQKAIPR